MVCQAGPAYGRPALLRAEVTTVCHPQAIGEGMALPMRLLLAALFYVSAFLMMLLSGNRPAAYWCGPGGWLGMVSSVPLPWLCLLQVPGGHLPVLLLSGDQPCCSLRRRMRWSGRGVATARSAYACPGSSQCRLCSRSASRWPGCRVCAPNEPGQRRVSCISFRMGTLSNSAWMVALLGLGQLPVHSALMRISR